MKTILVTGSRDWEDRGVLRHTLANLNAGNGYELLVHGDARGADTLAKEWAEDNGLATKAYPAPWKKYGKIAGRVRNVEMLKAHPDATVIAFPLPQSRGTVHCINEAVKMGRSVLMISPTGAWHIVTRSNWEHDRDTDNGR